MERLTKHSKQTSHENGICCTHFRGPECLGVGGNCAMNCKWEEAAWNRLAAYEDTGLEPDQIESMYMENQEFASVLCTNGDRAIALGKADAEGRVVVMPCKIGDTFFRPLRRRNIIEKCVVSSLAKKGGKSWKIRLTRGNFRSVFEIDANDIGKTVFLTREEAEKAMEDEKDD